MVSLPARREATHRPVWPLGLCPAHVDPTPWPCEPAAAELVATYGDGWLLAAHLWNSFEVAAQLMPTADPIQLREMVIVRPIEAVAKWMQAPRVIAHWSEVA